MARPESALVAHVDDEDKGVTELMTPGGKQKMVIINVDPEDRTVNESFTVNGTPITLINESGLHLPSGSRCPRNHVLHAFHVFLAPWERPKKGQNMSTHGT